MGADVIKVEPPGGDSARQIGPFVNDQPHPDRSLFFWFYNLNKRSLTLDYKHARGADLLLRLANRADMVIESFEPGRLERWALDGTTLHAQSGPDPAFDRAIRPNRSVPRFRRRRHGAGRALRDALRQRLRPASPGAPAGSPGLSFAGYYAAIAIMCALFARDRGGLGQWIDLSMQETATLAVEHVAASYFGAGQIEPRRGTLHWSR